MQLLLKTPKIQLSLLLLVIFITALVNNWSVKPIIPLIATLLATSIVDLAFLKIRGKPIFFPTAAIATGIIIAMLTSSTLPLYDGMLAGVIAMISKNFLRLEERHIVNPAAVGLFLSAFIFGHNVSWWAVSFQQFAIYDLQFMIYFLILLSPALVSVYRMKRHWIILSFLFTYGILNQILNTFLDPTFLFFSIVMLTEPMTTPNNHTRQIFFGIFIASIVYIFSSMAFSAAFPDVLIAALLLGNILFFKLR